jgi:rubredoxin
MEPNISNQGDFILTCPLCGYSFKANRKLGIKKLKCPMCGYEFESMDINPNTKYIG